MNTGPSKRMALAPVSMDFRNLYWAFENNGIGSSFYGPSKFVRAFEKSGVGSRIYQFPMWELGYPCDPICGSHVRGRVEE